MVATLLALAAAPALGDTIYKCIGAGGQISFEDRPCAAGEREEALPTRRIPVEGAPEPAISEPAPVTAAPAEPVAGDGRVAGAVYGEPFVATRARVYKVGAYVLELEEGAGAKPDKAITIFLWGSAGAPLGGRLFTSPDPALSQQPQIIVIWTTADGARRQKEITSGYTLRLTFAQPAGGTIDGRIALALPDDESLNIAGSFTAEIDY